MFRSRKDLSGYMSIGQAYDAQMNARACVCACLVVRLCDLKHYVGAQCRNGNRQEDQQSLTIRNWKLYTLDEFYTLDA